LVVPTALSAVGVEVEDSGRVPQIALAILHLAKLGAPRGAMASPSRRRHPLVSLPADRT
jgi:hypothetical protein